MNNPNNQLVAATIHNAVDLLGKAYDNLEDIIGTLDVHEARIQLTDAAMKLDSLARILRVDGPTSELRRLAPSMCAKCKAEARLELSPLCLPCS